MSGIRPPGCSKFAKNSKSDNDVTIFCHDVIVIFFWHCFFSFVKFSYWFKFHANIITGSGIMTVFFYKAWPGIHNRKYPRDWGKLRIPNLAPMCLIECYWILQNARVRAFTVFELLRENQLEGKFPSPPPRLELTETIVLSLKVIVFCIKSWQLLQRYGPFSKPLSKKYQRWYISYLFY